MKIEILYNLYTDGDYSLNNPEYFGCTGRNVKTEYDDFYDYVGSKSFENKNESTCRMYAKEFLEEFLCEGIHVSSSHYWLLKDFYNIIEGLMDVISEDFEGDEKEYIGELSGNQTGTQIVVTISK
ncbi:hypothetical protein [uncultured Clostridium sp.]|uniref:hypothetical protein n=1 Tax=uncultured Clostridium sp. TaxID=59620 RepID=UPI00267295C0|nr:hypothetical protein [uncultured Clostridium sp.]